MRIGDKNTADEIFVFGRHTGAAFAAASLRAIGRKRHTLDVSGMAHRHHHIFLRYQRFIVDFTIIFDKFRTARRRKFFAHRRQFFLNNRHHAGAAAQNVQQIRDLFAQFLQLIADFIAPHSGQALQTQLQNGARLRLTETIRAVIGNTV